MKKLISIFLHGKMFKKIYSIFQTENSQRDQLVINCIALQVTVLSQNKVTTTNS